MQPVIDPFNLPSVCDTLILQLAEENGQHGILYSDTSILMTDGTIQFSFSDAGVIGNNYYLVLKHRNSIDLWSKTAVPVVNEMLYDFSSLH
jgi:hypothetical protein